jgi:hypothetical protein
MSTSYNNQWVLRRSRWRGRDRAVAHRAAEQPPVPQRQLLDEHQPSEAPSEAEGAHGARGHGQAGRKRPRWIDRDT